MFAPGTGKPEEPLQSPLPDFRLRPIEAADDPAVAQLIGEVMAEFDASGPGFSSEDPEVTRMSSAYREPGHFFQLLIDRAGEIVGCGGFAPLQGVDPAELVCELRKVYFRPSARGRGLGRWLLDVCRAEARRAGYRTMYLETCGSMKAAIQLYERAGFGRLEARLGGTRHCGCNTFFAVSL